MSTSSKGKMQFKPINEIRQEYRMDVTDSRAFTRLIDELNSIAKDDIAHITAGQFVREYLDHLISDDENESEYYRKRLAEYAGGDFNGLTIVDDNDPSITYFHIPSIYLRLSTNTGKNELRKVGTMCEKVVQFNRSQFAEVPALRRDFTEYVNYYATDVLFEDDPDIKYYHGWYEIMDFFGRLYGEEFKLYQPIREKRQAGYRIYWVHPTPLDEYIEKHGRMTYGFIPPKSETLYEPEKSIPKQVLVIEDMSDWE